MDPFVGDWLNFLIRWGHLVAAIAWIGTSFYFVALDFSLKNGEAWEVHGGGFYHVRKYLTAPENLPPDLVWFKWEAYLAWVTGFLLLAVQYYAQASALLIDPAVLPLAPWRAILISLASLAAGWLVYNALCRALATRSPNLLAALTFLLIVAAAYGYTHVYAGRGAFIQVGAFIGTLMAANVFIVIVPNQRKITAALLRGEKPDPALGAEGKQRSLHNTYLTLPVLVTMVSNHFAFLTDHPYSWILVGLIVIGGAALRHFLVRHEVGDPLAKIAWTLPIIFGALAIAYAMTWTGPINQDWINLLLRWAHMIAGIAWIGTSFYFVALDCSLKNGEAWEVHGGGFYHVRKYLEAPATLPPDLIWFKWEAYLAWVTGFLLLVALYYVNASTYLIDPSVKDLEPWQAIAISVASLAGGWVIYNALCRSSLGENVGLLAVFVFALILISAYGYSQVFSGRGAMIHVGALIGTLMAANVFMVIIPNQRKITAALLKGEAPDLRLGAIGKQRSLHNTYLTLPALAMMVSNHYPMLTDHPQAWLLAGLIVLGGALARHFLLRIEVGDPQERVAWALPLIASALAVALLVTQPASVPAYPGDVSDAEALAIAQSRCAACHAATPTDKTVKAAPKGVMLDTLEGLRRHALQVETQAVRNKSMPLGNRTGMTPEERAKLGAWIARQ
jgi:uncharacterized membrane protein